MFSRREILMALGACTAAPRLVFAQQKKVWRIGILSPRSGYEPASDPFSVLLQSLRDLGYVEHRNVQYEWRFAAGNLDRMPALVGELIEAQPDILVALGTPGSIAARRAAGRIPLVMINVQDPVGAGIAVSLARPGGNVTGIATMSDDVVRKQFELIASVVPRLTRLGAVCFAGNVASNNSLKILRSAAEAAGARLAVAGARTPEEIERGIEALQKERVQALVVIRDAFLFSQNALIARLAQTRRLPSIGSFPEYAGAGGLMTYGAEAGEGYRRAAVHIDKIIKGAKPGDIPIEQPTKFELTVNMKTAKALGVKIPNLVLMQATKVIE